MRWIRGLCVGLTALLSVSTARQTSAQSGVVSGTVIERRTRAPVADAVVRIDSAGVSTRTDGRGAFRIAVTQDAVTLRVTRIGFAPAVARARVGQSLDIALDERAFDLDAVVVTGQTGETEMRALGNAVGRIDVARIVQFAPPVKLQDMLSVNVPGVRVMSGGGGVGIGGTTRIRGAGSLSLSNEPLIYVDGVRTDNSNGALSAAYGRGLAYFGRRIGYQWEVPSRVNDIDPEQIESIEVLKGPAAAALYGTEAANGVIQIITKRGKSGAPTIETRLSIGANWLPDQYDKWAPAWFVNSIGELQEFNRLKYNRAQGAPAVFSPGFPLGASATLSGGTDAVRYFASAAVNREEGIVPYNWQNQFSGRVNLSYTRNALQLDANFGLTRSRTRTSSGAWPITSGVAFAWCGDDGSICRDRARMPIDTTYSRGWGQTRPEDYADDVFAYDNLDRSILGFKASHAPAAWFFHRLQVGADVNANLGDNLTYKHPFGVDGPHGTASDGYRAVSNLRTSYRTVDYAATATFSPSTSITSATSVGGQFYQKTRDYVSALGEHFAIPGPGDISGARVQQASQANIPNKTLGLYVQEQISWNRRLFVTAAFRGDDNSAFGANYNFVLYPKVSASWVLSDEPYFMSRVPVLETFRLRVAYGRAGQQPDAFAAVRQYQPVVAYNGQSGLTPAVIGNPDLRPEVGKEIEAGFDASLRNQRVSLDFTYYDKVLDDAIIAAPVRPSSGFAGTKLINSGQTENSGVELGLGATLVDRGTRNWSMRGTLATNSARVNRLLAGQDQQFVGEVLTQYNVIGFAPYSYFYRRVVGSNILTEPDTTKWRADCAGGAAFSRGDGTVVPCESANLLYGGRPTPSWSGSLSSTVKLSRGFELFALVDFVGGNSIVSGDVGFGNLRGGPGRTATATTAVMDSVRLHGSFAGTTKLLPHADSTLAGQMWLNAPDAFAVNGLLKNGFARLRTISASYTFSPSNAARLGASRGSVNIAAENVAMLWREQESKFGRKLVDPEIGQNNTANGLEQYHQERWPLFTRVTFTLRLTY